MPSLPVTSAPRAPRRTCPGGTAWRLTLGVVVVLVLGACSSDATTTEASDGTTATVSDQDGGTDQDEGPGTDTTTSTPDGSAPDPSWSWPGASWDLEDPEEQGLDPQALAELLAYGEETGSNCLVVVHDGVLVAEQYWNGTDADSRQEVFSVSKSVTAALVGIAQDLGHLDLEQPVSDVVDEWQGTDSEDVTIANLLQNDSGRYYDFVTDYLEMTNAEDRTAFAIALDQQHPVGEHWEYNNAAIQVLQAVLVRSTGQTVNDFAAEHLFGPTGMGSTIATDPSGNEATFMGTQASCLDLARFAYLHLRAGWWEGEPVISSAFVSEATTPSQELNTAYGYLWWLNSDAGWVQAAIGTTGDGRFWPDAPADAYAALGLGNQVALVLPTEDMVVVRLGSFGGAGGTDDDGAPVPTANVNRLAELASAAVVD